MFPAAVYQFVRIARSDLAAADAAVADAEAAAKQIKVWESRESVEQCAVSSGPACSHVLIVATFHLVELPATKVAVR